MLFFALGLLPVLLVLVYFKTQAPAMIFLSLI